jgi:hypothetical protein
MAVVVTWAVVRVVNGGSGDLTCTWWQLTRLGGSDDSGGDSVTVHSWQSVSGNSGDGSDMSWQWRQWWRVVAAVMTVVTVVQWWQLRGDMSSGEKLRNDSGDGGGGDSATGQSRQGEFSYLTNMTYGGSRFFSYANIGGLFFFKWTAVTTL